MKTKKLTPEEYHKWYKSTYEFISKISHESHYKPVVRGGEACVIPVDKEGNEVIENKKAKLNVKSY